MSPTKKVPGGTIKYYFELQEEYQKKYGSKTVVIMQIGTFFEVYEYRLPNKKLGMSFKLSRDIDQVASYEFAVSLRNKSSEHSISNPYMMGFQTIYLDRWKHAILKSGYTIILVEQKKILNEKGKTDIRRFISKILTQGTDIDRIHHVQPLSSKIVSIVIDFQRIEKRHDLSLIICGYSSIDLISGEIIMEESTSTIDDPLLPLLKLSRFLSIRPRELIIRLVYTPSQLKKFSELTSNFFNSYRSYLSKYLMLHFYKKHSIIFRDGIPKDYFRASYQKQFLEEVYSQKLTELENLNYEQLLCSTSSLICLLEYCNDHDENITKKVSLPKIESNNDSKHLFISQSTIIQLNLYDNYYLTMSKEYSNLDSVLSVINKTRTALGKRYLIKRFTKPYVSRDKIEYFYSSTGELVDGYKVGEKNQINEVFLLDKLYSLLGKVPDISFLHRKLLLGNIRFNSLHRLIRAYFTITEIFNTITKYQKQKSKGHNLRYIPMLKFKGEMKILFVEYVKMMKRIFDMDAIFKNPTVEDNYIDSITPIFQDSIKKYSFCESDDYLHSKAGWESEYYPLLKFKENLSAKTSLEYKYDRYYMIITKTESEKIPTGKIKINSIRGFGANKYNVHSKISEKYCISAGKFRKEYQLQSYKIFANVLKIINKKYSKVFKPIEKFIAKLDYIVSSAKCAVKNNYCRPKIDSSGVGKYGSINIKDLRHPIVERIIDDEYIPNNVILGSPKTSPNGILLFGCNSSGKSTLTKALGIAIIMAQSGYWVPAKEMIFSPYTSLISRLSGNDNIFKGESSFVVEMKETNTIMRHADKFSMILGDELCRGTESTSGTALTLTTLEFLLQKDCSFIFSTHMHHLPSQPELSKYMSSKDLQICHLGVKYDEIFDMRVYDRKLKEGQGGTMYGIEVAKSVGLPKAFIERSYQIRKRFLKDTVGSTDILPTKRSRYSSNLYVKKCAVCGSHKNLETHHIRPQRDANDIKYIGHVYRDSKGNMSILCRKCHDKMECGYKIVKNGKKFAMVKDE